MLTIISVNNLYLVDTSARSFTGGYCDAIADTWPSCIELDDHTYFIIFFWLTCNNTPLMVDRFVACEQAADSLGYYYIGFN